MTRLNTYTEVEATMTMRTLADLNFLRDAWRIDVAMQHGALMITSDRLSYALMQRLDGPCLCFHVLQYGRKDGTKLVFEAELHIQE